MKIKHKNIATAVFGFIFLLVGMIALPASSASAADELKCGILPQSLCNDAKKTDSNVRDTATWGLLKLGVQILTAGVAIVAVGGIIYGATLYMSAGGSQEQLKKAKSIFLNVVIGVVAFGMMFALLQWLVPGGVF